MTPEEFSNQFDLHYNNITSNQAPGLTEYEKSVFLTKAQDEIVKNYFTANSKGNNIGQGFDDSAKRQADFSVLMKTEAMTSTSLSGNNDTITYTVGGETKTFTISKIDDRSYVYAFPSDVFIVVNETFSYTGTSKTYRYQVIPLRFDEYTKYMSKPFKRPLKNQVWRLINSGNAGTYQKFVEIVTSPDITSSTNCTYKVRYVRRPKPIITGNLDGLTINGYYLTNTTTITDATATDGVCELDPILHEDILQRAVELAKIAWTATGNDNVQAVMAAGQRSE